MLQYTHSLAFIFNQSLDRVILIQKQRPSWQKGLWNGLGGKVEPRENLLECVKREVHEESGLDISQASWYQMADMSSQTWRVGVLATDMATNNLPPVVSATGEDVNWFETTRLPQVVDNLIWLIPLCQNRLQNPDLLSVKISYDSTHRT